MLIKSGVITSGSGSVGGITLSRNKGGMYFRGRAIPTNPSSTLQAEQRNALSDVASTWNTLTAEQVDGWNQWATTQTVKNAVGDNVQLSGQQCFNRANILRARLGLELVTTAPVLTTQPVLGTVVFTVSGTVDNFGATITDNGDWAHVDDAYLVIFAGRPAGVGTSYFNGPYRLIGTIAGDSDTAPLNATLDSPWAIDPGEKVWGYARVVMPDGRISDAQEFGPLIAT